MNQQNINKAFGNDVLGLEKNRVHCFPAGTLVHTDKGLVPIQNIKVGNMVLSRPVWNGRDAPPEYKRVTRAFCSGEHELIRLSCQHDSEYDDIDAPIYIEFMTPNHPVWVDSMNDWIPVSRLEIGTLLSSIHNKDNLRVLSIEPVYKGYIENDYLIGGCYSPSYGNYDAQELDMEIRFSKDGYYFINYNKYLSPSKYHIEESQILQLSEEIIENAIDHIYSNENNLTKLNVPVYNLEVEEHHTYFIGEHGIWVHHSNCFHN